MANVFQRLGALLRSPAPSRAALRRFEAARIDRLTASWQAADTAINQELRNDLRLLRRRARQMAKDNEYLKRFLGMVSSNVIGQGMILQSRPMDGSVMDNLAAAAIEQHWWRWLKPAECDVAGKSGLWTMMRTAATALARDGEILIRLHRGRGTYGLQLQLLDIERLDWQMNRARQGTQNAIEMGVEMDVFGKPVAYHILPTLPTTYGGEPTGQAERVPASDIVHAFVPTDLEQSRGYPWAHAAMRRMNDLQGYREAAVIAARIGASKMGFFTSEQPDILPDGKDEDGVPYTSATPGEFGILPPGTNFTPYDPQYPHDQFDTFVKATLRGISSALGVSYNTLANDLEGVNYSSIRSGVLEEREQWICLQDWFIEAVMDPVFDAWLQMALSLGVLTQNGRRGPEALPVSKIDKFRGHHFMARRWAWVDPLKDVQATLMAVEAGMTTLTDACAKAGVDIEDVFATKQRENQLAAQYGVTLGDLTFVKPDTGSAGGPDSAEPEEEDQPVRMFRRSHQVQTPPPTVHVTVNNAQPEQRAPEVNVNVEPAQVNVPAPVVNVAAPEVRVDVPPSEVRVDVPAPLVNVQVDAPIVNVAAPVVEVTVEAEMPTPDITLEMPARKTETTITRDAGGRITSTTQLETDA